MRAIAFESRLACPTCDARLHVPLVYIANVTIASFVLGAAGAYMLGAEAQFVHVMFLLTFAFAVVLGTAAVTLAPPKLDS